jgi:hypothetical protein
MVESMHYLGKVGFFKGGNEGVEVKAELVDLHHH